MTTNLPKLKELAQAAQQNQYDPVALNDYGMAVPPATVLELIAEIERHRQVNAEGCKPDSSILLSGLPGARATSCRSLDTAEDCKPDLFNAPFFYALAGPDGKPHYDDFCVADNPADLECHEEGITIVPLFTHPAHQNEAALREDIERGNRIQLAMALHLSAIAQSLGIPPEEQQGGAAESIVAIQKLQSQLAAIKAASSPAAQDAGLSDVLPSAAIEGDQLVIRITTECLLHAVTCSSQWPVNEAGLPISINDGPLLIKEIIDELQREDEQGTNSMHRMLDEAALAALDNGSEAVDYDEVRP